MPSIPRIVSCIMGALLLGMAVAFTLAGLMGCATIRAIEQVDK